MKWLNIIMISLFSVALAAAVSAADPGRSPSEQELIDAIKYKNSKTVDEQKKAVNKAAQAGIINQSTLYGKTFLNLAIAKGRYSIVEALLEAGADPNKKNGRGRQYPLVMTLYNKQVDLAQLLVKYGAKLDVLTKSERTRLYLMAIKKGKWTLALKLIDDHGIDVNKKDKSKKNAFLYAVSWGNIKMVQELIDREAYIRSKKSGRYEALDIILKEKRVKSAKFRKKLKDKENYQYEKLFALLVEKGLTPSAWQARTYAKRRYTHSGFWRFFITTKISVWTLLGILAIIGSIIYYYNEGDLEEFGIISGAVMIFFTIIVLIIEGLCLINPMWHISVANNLFGSFAYLLLRLSAITALVPVAMLMNEGYESSGSSSDGSSYSVSKTCSGCGGSVPAHFSIGSRCPHCGGVFGGERWK